MSHPSTDARRAHTAGTGSAATPSPLDSAALAARAEDLLELARRAGADEAEVVASAGRSASLGYEKGEAKTAHVARSQALGLRVFVDRRLGFVATNQLERGALEAAAVDAVALARSSPRDEANVLPTPRAMGSDAVTPEQWDAAQDPALHGARIEEVAALTREFVDGVAARDPRLSIDRAEVSVHAGVRVLRATTGLALEEADSGASGSVFGMAVDGDDVGGFDSRGMFVRRLADLAPALERAGARFAETCLGNLRAGAAESYRGPVLLSPEALRAILLAPLLGSVSALAVQRGRSKLANALDTVVAHPSLTLRDAPEDLALAGAQRFDREGQPARPFPIVDRGVLRSHLYNGYAAAVAGRVSTGHATGGAQSLPGLGVHALVVEGGDGGDLHDLARTLGRGLLVQRFSGSVESASGDFSGVAKSARWIEGGVVVRSVREVLLAGNAFELLRGALTLASEPELVHGSARIPWALVDGFTVTAG